MRRAARPLLAALPLAIGAATPAAPDPALQQRLAGLVAEAPRECIDQQFASGPATYHGALVYDAGRRLYVNRLRGGCPFLQPEDAIRVDAFTGQLCRGDHATPFVPSTGIVRPTCILGPFETYAKPKRRGHDGGPGSP